MTRIATGLQQGQTSKDKAGISQDLMRVGYNAVGEGGVEDKKFC